MTASIGEFGRLFCSAATGKPSHDIGRAAKTDDLAHIRRPPAVALAPVPKHVWRDWRSALQLLVRAPVARWRADDPGVMGVRASRR